MTSEFLTHRSTTTGLPVFYFLSLVFATDGRHYLFRTGIATNYRQLYELFFCRTAFRAYTQVLYLTMHTVIDVVSSFFPPTGRRKSGTSTFSSILSSTKCGCSSTTWILVEYHTYLTSFPLVQEASHSVTICRRLLTYFRSKKRTSTSK